MQSGPLLVINKVISYNPYNIINGVIAILATGRGPLCENGGAGNFGYLI